MKTKFRKTAHGPMHWTGVGKKSIGQRLVRVGDGNSPLPLKPNFKIVGYKRGKVPNDGFHLIFLGARA